MLTVPNTLGVFEKEIPEISKLAGENGTLLYYDGANLNAVMNLFLEKIPQKRLDHLILPNHIKFVDAILSRDPMKAREAVLEHLRNAAKRANLQIYAP